MNVPSIGDWKAEAVLVMLWPKPLGQGSLDRDLKYMEQPTELKHITQWRKDKQLRLLQ